MPSKPRAAARKRNAAPPDEQFSATKIVHRRVDDLKPYPRNPRTHSPEQIDLLAALIRRHGFDQPIVVDEHDVILKGHGRQMAARKLDLETVPTIVREGLSDLDKRAMVIEDNQVALLSGWDKDLLKLELGELKRLDYPLELTGFSADSLVSYLAAPLQQQPPEGFQEFDDETIETHHECPKCKYRWSGSSAPKER